jgi:hypothetical protein
LRHHDDRGRGWRHDNDDDRDRSHRARGVRGLLARASAMRSSLRASVLRPTYLGIRGHQPQRVARGLPTHLPRRGSDR